jgi:23S rRNA pseudouridine1911/1915/1917 synthase
LDISQTPLSVIVGDESDMDVQAGDQTEEIKTLTLTTDLHGQRLDRALTTMLPEFSRSHLQQLIVQGCVTDADGQVLIKSAHKVKAGQPLKVILRPTDESQAFVPQDMALDSIHCDGHLRVINKPAGLVVHPAPGHWGGTLLNGLLALDPLSRQLPRAGIVHRLDKDTSGLMMVARTRMAMDALVVAIAQRTVKREYLALVHGPWVSEGVTSLRGSIGRDPTHRLRMAVLDDTRHAAKPSITHVRCLAQVPGYALLHCQLETGRTHQIRVHLSHAGHPLVGDSLYGGKSVAGFARQALHAWKLALTHPITAEPLNWTQAPPDDFVQLCQQVGLGYNFNQ